MTIDEVYKFVSYVSNKTQRGNLKPDDFNLLAPRAQMDLFMQRYGNPNEYQYGRPMPRIAWQMTQKITDDMKEFLVPLSVNISDTGQVKYPSDYAHLSSARGIWIDENQVSYEVKLEPLNDNQLGNVLFSYINMPTKLHPVLGFYADYMQVYPKEITSAVITYLRYPKNPVWAYTQPQGSIGLVYDPTKSVQFEMPSDTHSEICYRILSYLGVNLRDQQLSQYAEMMKRSGGN